MTKISIILPTFNCSETIREAINSVKKITLKNLELIVIDGGSTDGTLKILEENKNIISKLIIEKDKGVYDAMNKGVEVAKGEWLYFLGADDSIINGAFPKCLRLLKKNQINYGNVIFKSTNEIYDGKFSKYKLMLRNFPHQAMFYPKSIFKNYKYDLKYKVLSDYAFNIRISKFYKFNYFDINVAIYNDIGGISSSKNDMDFERDRKYLYSKYLGKIYTVIYTLRASLLKLIRLFK